VIGPASPGVASTGGIRVRNLAAGQSVLLRNLSPVFGPVVSTNLKVLLENNVGTVWIEDCEWNVSTEGMTQIKNCAEVVLLHSVFKGGQEPDILEITGSGIVAVKAIDSSVHAYGCEFTGGSGSLSSFITYGSAGADAFQLQGGSLFAADCAFIGGAAAIVPGSDCADGGSGDGLQLTAGAAAPSANTLGCVFSPGAAETGCSPFYIPGKPVNVAAGTHQELAGLPCSLDVQASVGEGELLSVAFTGAPDAAAFLALSFEPDAVFFPPLLGSLLLGPPYAVVLGAPLGPSGSLQLDLPVGFLPPGVEVLLFHGQLGLFLTDGTFQLCSGSAVSLLDEQF